MLNAIKNYWKPYFEGRLLGELTRQDLNGFIDSLGKRAVEPAKAGKKADGREQKAELSAARKT
jgi:hypothetical protein